MSAPAGNASAEEGVKTPLGAIVGIVTDSAKLPVAHATVTAVRADGGGIRATVSNSDGVYSFADLTPGAWSVSVESDGQRTSSSAALAVLAGQATRADLALNGSAASRLATAPAPVPAAPPTAESLAQAVARIVPEALQAPEQGPAVDTQTPFAVGYLGWMNGTSREKEPIFDTKLFTPEVRFDVNYLTGLQPPSGSHHRRLDRGVPLERVPDRAGQSSVVTSTGTTSVPGFYRCSDCLVSRHRATTRAHGVGPVGSARRLQILLGGERRISLRCNHGLNVDAGIFVSYIGLFSYYNFDNWTYQPSFVSSNTPWFFNGLRDPMVSDTKPEDRALADQRLAILCQVQQSSGVRRADPLDSERLVQTGLEHLQRRTRQSSQAAAGTQCNGGNPQCRNRITRTPMGSTSITRNVTSRSRGR